MISRAEVGEEEKFEDNELEAERQVHESLATLGKDCKANSVGVMGISMDSNLLMNGGFGSLGFFSGTGFLVEVGLAIDTETGDPWVGVPEGDAVENAAAGGVQFIRCK